MIALPGVIPGFFPSVCGRWLDAIARVVYRKGVHQEVGSRLHQPAKTGKVVSRKGMWP